MPTSLPQTTATPIGTLLNTFSTPTVRVSNGSITVTVRDLVRGLRDYYAIVIDTRTERLFGRRRVRVPGGRGSTTFVNVPPGTYRVYGLATTPSGPRHSPARIVVVP